MKITSSIIRNYADIYGEDTDSEMAKDCTRMEAKRDTKVRTITLQLENTP